MLSNLGGKRSPLADLGAAAAPPPVAGGVALGSVAGAGNADKMVVAVGVEVVMVNVELEQATNLVVQ